jgi:hypothetical protein
MYGWREVRVRVCVLALAIVVSGVVSYRAAWGRRNGAQDEHVTTVHGRVLNRVTKEPIARALVTMGDEYATMTDDRGQFEMKLVQQAEQGLGVGGLGGSRATGNERIGVMLRSGPARVLQAKKPGFLESNRLGMERADKSSDLEATIYLAPEALIVGRVTLAGLDGDVRIRCELYRHQVREGKRTWEPVGTVTTWGSGEFRFSGLDAGTYRLITHEEMDRDSFVVGPGAPLFGYPPVYYQNTWDFSAASPIVVKAGETVPVNLNVTRRQYYPVRIPVRNAPLAGADVTVHPVGHWGPGWSLAYNPMQRVIEGMLPDGNYTVELETHGKITSTGIGIVTVELETPGQTRSTGVGNFTVNGAALEGAPLYLTQDAAVTVNVRTEFQSGPNGEPQESSAEVNRARLAHLLVTLQPLEPFGSAGRNVSSRPVEGTENRTLTIANVRPGQYRVLVQASKGYLASAQSGGVDLLKQPFVVGAGAGVAPIEITLRDDGAEVSGTVEGVTGVQGDGLRGGGNIPQYWRVFLVPIERGISQEPPWRQTSDGSFKISNVPPGDYWAVAYEEGPGGLNVPFGEPEFVKSLEEQGQMIHLEAGEKIANVKVKVLPENNGDEDSKE